MSAQTTLRDVFERIRPVPYVEQVNQAECGVASLAMVLAHFGRKTRLDEIREQMSFGVSGLAARTILEAARRFGLQSRGVRIDLEHLDALPRASILHWEFNHYVVFDRVNRDGSVVINDPRAGRVVLPPDEVSKRFTGIALTFEPSATLERRRLPNATWHLLRQVLTGEPLVRRVLLLSLVIEAVSLTLPLVTGLVVDRLLPHNDHDLFRVMTVGAVALASYYCALVYVREQLMVVLRVRFDASLTMGLFEHLMSLPFSYFQARDTAHLAHRFHSTAWIRDAISAGVTAGLLDAVFAVVALVALFGVQPFMGLVALGAGAVQVGILVGIRGRLMATWRQDLELMMKSQGVLMEFIGGIETIKLAGAEGRAFSDWANLYTATANNLARRGGLEAMLAATKLALGFLGPIAVLLAGGWVVMHNEVSVGTMLAASAMGVAFLNPLGHAAMELMQLGALKIHAERLDDVFSQPRERKTGETKAPVDLQGGVCLSQVSYRYSPDLPEVLQDVSLDVAPGSFVAIVGPTGSGKTTLGRVLAGLVEPSAGTVRYDGHRAEDLDLASLRHQVAAVTQHTRLFARTVRDNVTLLDDSVPLEQVETALRHALLWDEVQRLPTGVHTEIAEDGRSLSGGQRQRLAVARALLRRPKVLLLDEATSALDTDTERRLQKNLDDYACTKVVIAHRLSTVKHADRIVVLDAGRIVAEGTHAELVAAGGIYADLVEAQLSAEAS